jgi:biotin transport system substrate-specific component
MSQVAVTLRSWAAREVVTDRRARLGLGVLAFVLAMAFGAYVAIPVPGSQVPVTLQALFVILAGVLLGPLPGAAAMASYVALGAAGAPVFSMGGAGLPWLIGPTGGYLLAMPAAAFAAGYVAGGDRRGLRLLAGLTVGMAVIYVGGVSQLWLLTRQSLGTLIGLGVLPFLFGDVMKTLVAFVLVRSVRMKSPGR